MFEEEDDIEQIAGNSHMVNLSKFRYLETRLLPQEIEEYPQLSSIERDLAFMQRVSDYHYKSVLAAINSITTSRNTTQKKIVSLKNKCSNLYELHSTFVPIVSNLSSLLVYDSKCLQQLFVQGYMRFNAALADFFSSSINCLSASPKNLVHKCSTLKEKIINLSKSFGLILGYLSLALSKAMEPIKRKRQENYHAQLRKIAGHAPEIAELAQKVNEMSERRAHLESCSKELDRMLTILNTTLASPSPSDSEPFDTHLDHLVQIS